MGGHSKKNRRQIVGVIHVSTNTTDLDSNVPVDGAINLTSACVLAKREHHIIRGVETFPEGLTEDIFGIAVVLPHEPEATPTNVFPLSTDTPVTG